MTAFPGHPSFGQLLGNAQLSGPPRWIYVTRRFTTLLATLNITSDQLEDGNRKLRGVIASLNRAYWDSDSETDNGIPIGSWGKRTRVRPPRDIDVLFPLPAAVYHRFEQRSGNRQSQLLQEVKEHLEDTYPATRMRGDGQVVLIPFNTYAVEVVPAFALTDGGYFVCDANGGGQYKSVYPHAELAALDAADTAMNGNVRKLTRIMKQWQRYCDVPIKSFHIEALVKETLRRFDYGRKDEFWFDWLVRDVLAHLISRSNGTFVMPSSTEMVALGNAWLSKAETAYQRALKACEYERANYNVLAGEEWQKIFGTAVPRMVT